MKKNHPKLSTWTRAGGLFALLAAAAPVNAVQPDTALSASAPRPQNAIVTDRIIVKYKSASPQSKALSLSRSNLDKASVLAGTPLRHARRLTTGAQLLSLEGRKSKQEIADIIQGLMADPNVEYAEPDLLLRPMAIPADPRYSEQWHYFEPAAGLNLPSAWDITQGEGAVVAVIDTGYRPHGDLIDNLLPGYDMIFDPDIAQDGDGRDADATDPGDWAPAGACPPPFDDESASTWHGTHVAGTIAAVGNNGIGVAGAAYRAKVVPIRTVGRCGGYSSDTADAIVWAAGGHVEGLPPNPNPAQVINLSLGENGRCGVTIQGAIDTARSLGATLVVAAGNEIADAVNSTPANCTGVITVASVDRSGGRAWYSNFGSVVDVAAPGGDTQLIADGVLSTFNEGLTLPTADGYEFYQGTSMATPHVAGAAALLYAAKPDIKPDAVETLLKRTARAFPADCLECGAGIVDAAAAVKAALADDGSGDTDGLNETGLAGERRSWREYTLEVAAGTAALNVVMAGGSGDADLYVRYGSAPTRNRFDCRPYQLGNDETCSFDNPPAGTWYISVFGYGDYSGVSLQAQ